MWKASLRLTSVLVAVAIVSLPALAEEMVDSQARSDAVNAQSQASQAQQGLSDVAGGLVTLEGQVTALEAD